MFRERLNGKSQFMIVMLLFLIGGCNKTTNTPQLHSVKFNQNTVVYDVQGSGEKTVLFIHGWSCDMDFWKYQTPEFRNEYKVIRVDLPGHGKSDKPKIDYTQDYFADSIKAVLDNSNIDRAVIVGHSSGFGIAWQFAMKYPQKTEAICSVDGAYLNPPTNPTELAEWTRRNKVFADGFKQPDRDEQVIQFIESMFTEKTTPKLRDFIKQKMLTTPAYVGNSAMEDFVKTEIWQNLPELNTPVLAIYITSPDLPADNEQYLGSKFKNLTYLKLDEYSHFFMLENPTYFNSALKDFLKDL